MSKKAEKVVDEKPTEKANKITPRLFFDVKKAIEVEITGFYSKEDGSYLFAVPNGVKEDSDKFLVFNHVFKFKPVPYNRLNLYRQQSGRINESNNEMIYDGWRIRDFLWTFHLEGWNLIDENGVNIPVQHDPDGTTSSSTLELLYKLPASVLDLAMTELEKKIGIAW